MSRHLLENSQGIDSYGVSMTTLEEIFLKLGEEEESKKEELELKVRMLYILHNRLLRTTKEVFPEPKQEG